MNLYDLLMKRRSVRQFEKREIPDWIVDELLDAANSAPSGGNIQPLSIVLVQKPERRAELARINGNQPWVKNAPLSMVFCLDFARIKRWASMLDAEFKGERALAHFLIGYADLMCAAQNAVILAEGHGLGSVFVGTIQSSIDWAREFLALPMYVVPMMVLSLGYPRSVPKGIPKFDRDVIVHREQYSERSDAEIRSAFESKYGEFGPGDQAYFKKAYIEVIEAEAQGETGQIDMALERMKQLEIRNNAQFLFRLRYPADLMVRLNELVVGSFMNAGFDLFP
jgi:FMN reductase [NAD(P)H]